MANILAMIRHSCFIIALTVLLDGCNGPWKSAQRSNLETLWAVTKEKNHAEAVSIRGITLDLSGLESFRVVRPSYGQFLGLLSSIDHGYLLLFDDNGALIASRKTGAIRDFKLPDPGILDRDPASAVTVQIDKIFLTEGSLVGSAVKALTFHLYRLRRNAIEEIWKAEAYVESNAGENTVDYRMMALFDDTNHEIDNRQFFYLTADLLNKKIQNQLCTIKQNDAVSCELQ